MAIQVITPLPDPPTRTDPDNFDTRADAFMTALPQMVTEENVAGGQIGTANESCTNSVALAEGAKDAAVAASGASVYSAVTTYDFPDTVICTDGNSYRCVGTSVLGDNPVGSVTGDWQKITGGSDGVWFNVTASRTVSPGDQMLADTTAGSITLTLPAAPVAGASYFRIADLGQTWSTTNKVVLARNGLNIMGLAEDMDCEFPGDYFSMLYVSASFGWRFTS